MVVAAEPGVTIYQIIRPVIRASHSRRAARRHCTVFRP